MRIVFTPPDQVNVDGETRSVVLAPTQNLRAAIWDGEKGVAIFIQPVDGHDHVVVDESYFKPVKDAWDVAPPTNTIAEMRERTLLQINGRAELARMKFLTPGSIQMLTYIQKQDEAKAANNDPTPTAAKYPMLAAMVGIDGDSIKNVATTVLAAADSWNRTSITIERTRRLAKRAAESATTSAELQAILDGLPWKSGVR